MSASYISHAQLKTDTNYATRIVSATWMPDGQSILIAVVKYHKTDNKAPFYSKIFRYQLAGRQLTLVLENASNISVSPDGNSIAFLKRDDSKRTDVYFFDLKTKQEKMIKTDSFRKSAMKWSPDGKKLTYNVSIGTNSSEASVEIFVHDLSKGITRQVTSGGGQKNYSPTWSPDSKRIVYYVEKGDHHDQIWITDANGSFHSKLTDDSTHNFFPTWMDNQMIVYNSSPAGVVMMNVNNRSKQKIGGIDGEGIEYNAKAKKFVYILAEGENELIVFDLVTKTARPALKGDELITVF